MLNLRTSTVALFVSLAACGGPMPGEEGPNLEGLEGFEEAATVCPGSTKSYGIDVAQWQGSINWSAVKSAGKQFAIIRVSDGTGHPDPYFASNWRNAKAAGLVVGSYQFFRPGQNATAQADLM